MGVCAATEEKKPPVVISGQRNPPAPKLKSIQEGSLMQRRKQSIPENKMTPTPTTIDKEKPSMRNENG